MRDTAAGAPSTTDCAGHPRMRVIQELIIRGSSKNDTKGRGAVCSVAINNGMPCDTVTQPTSMLHPRRHLPTAELA